MTEHKRAIARNKEKTKESEATLIEYTLDDDDAVFENLLLIAQ